MGPFEARFQGRQVDVGNRRQERCLLAILLLEADRQVPTERLIDLLWPVSPPPSARSAVHTYVGRLRRALNPCGVTILTGGNGYRIKKENHRIDVCDFRRLAEDAAKSGDPAERVRLLDEALALWRGPMLAGLADERLRHRLDGSLEESRLAGVESRAEAKLTLGRHTEVIEELVPLAEENPARERLIASLMTALYRDARQADALRLYRTTWKRLMDGAGVEPGQRLQELHRRVLRNDHRLAPVRRAVFEVRVREESLPWSVSGHPALDFCNTFAGWGMSSPLPGAEWLRTYRTLAVWTGYSGLPDEDSVTHLVAKAEHDPEAAEAVLQAARELRAGLYAYLTERRDFDRVKAFVEEAARVVEFVRDNDGRGRLRPALRSGLSMPVHAVAWSASELLSEPRMFTIKACQSRKCGWLFLDETGRRRFCSLATCVS